MLYVRQPTQEERQELERMQRQEIGRVSQRAHLILLSSERHTVPEIARLFHTSRVTVRFWMRRFDREGPPGLYDEPVWCKNLIQIDLLENMQEFQSHL